MTHAPKLAAALALLCALQLGLAGASKIGYPCTQYKPADIARAKAYRAVRMGPEDPPGAERANRLLSWNGQEKDPVLDPR